MQRKNDFLKISFSSIFNVIVVVQYKILSQNHSIVAE